MNHDELKNLVKEVINEIRGGTSGEHDVEDAEVDGQTITRIITPQHVMKFNIRVEYDATAGCPAKLYGPPENSYPGEDPSVDMVDAYMTDLEIMPPKTDKYVPVNLERLKAKYPQIYEAFNKITYKYAEDNWDKISDDIFDDLNNQADDVPDDDREDERDWDRQ